MNGDIRKPNLFIVGEPRSGTTALYNYLRTHPQIFFPKVKEPSHFASYYFEEYIEIHRKQLKNQEINFPKFYYRNNYLNLYKNRKEKYLGDASTKYLYSEDASKRIDEFNPDSKIIALFREPVDFLFSYHSRQLFLLNEYEPNLIKALKLEKLRQKGEKLNKSVKLPSSLLYSERLKFSEHIKRYLDYFPIKQIKIVIFEDFKKNNKKTLVDIYKFLNVNENHIPKFSLYNKNKKIRNRNLKKLIDKYILNSQLSNFLPKKIYFTLKNLIKKLLSKNIPSYSLNSELKLILKKRFKDEVIRLNHILNKYDLIKFNLIKKWGYDTV